MGHWWYRNILEPGKLPLLLALLSFVLSFLITRVITRLIRAGRGPFKNVTPGGVHIHHVVPGVILVIIGGFGAISSGRQGFDRCSRPCSSESAPGWYWTSSR